METIEGLNDEIARLAEQVSALEDRYENDRENTFGDIGETIDDRLESIDLVTPDDVREIAAEAIDHAQQYGTILDETQVEDLVNEILANLSFRTEID